MRDWTEIDKIYDELIGSIYPQPEDNGHTDLAQKSIQFMFSKAISFRTVLDFGCGTGFCQPMFERYGVEYLGFAMGEDVQIAQNLGRNVVQMDYNFIDADVIVDAGFSRHSLEHSPFPILTLCHWKRFIRTWLMIVLPAPEWYMYRGQNHFNVMAEGQAENVFEQAGYDIAEKKIEYRWGLPYMDAPTVQTKYEYWYLLKKR